MEEEEEGGEEEKEAMEGKVYFSIPNLGYPDMHQR